MKEIWKDVVGFEGFYKVSNIGRVKSLTRYVNTKIKYHDKKLVNGKILKQDNNLYYTVVLSKYGIYYKRLVHRLVAQAFIPNLLNKPQVNHIDGNKLNNNVNNLEWVTHKENTQHAIKTKLIVFRKSTYEERENMFKAKSKIKKCKVRTIHHYGNKVKKISLKKDGIVYNFDSYVDAQEFLDVCKATLSRYLKANRQYIRDYEIIEVKQ